MKPHIDKVLKHIALVTLILSALIMGFILYELSLTKHNVARELVEKAVDQTKHELEDFFNPVKNQLKTSSVQAQMKSIDDYSLIDYHKLFVPVIQNYSQISSLGIATSEGFEHDILIEENSNEWLTREVHIEKTGFEEFWTAYKINEENKVQVDSSWVSKARHDPRSRPWFQGADKELNKLYWTSPYLFNTNQKMGITVSSSWIDPFNPDRHVVLAYDLTLEYISDFTSGIRPTKNGEIMITTGDRQFVIGMPREADHDLENLGIADSVRQKELLEVLNHEEIGEPFVFASEGENWWGICESFELNDEQSFMIFAALPENDFLAELKQSQRLLGGGFAGILLLAFLVMRSHNKQIRNQKQLRQKNAEITAQNKLIASKNKEILDSINYAKRIQTAILPSDKLVKSYLDSSFVLYLPKDIVAGDFYWMESKGDFIMFAAADCTGHGVPGAMVSVMCHNALNRSVKEFGLIQPNDILDKTRELVLEEFSKSEEDVKDGMDISLCVLNVKTNILWWSGANNPLWLIPSGESKVKQLKADKQPVGSHPGNKPFSVHEIQLQKGDKIYIFTDGLQDQFGGLNYKKFKPSRLRKLILEIKDLPPEEQRLKIWNAFKEWKGDQDQVDDICVIGVEI
ncbi:MAG: SpoIIE family protein phosphatase [Brumimicrobium sp.]|nr:SpoIIE family protein phosphatase [Brumimicrobium sp.]